ncbi:hypothetical protein GJAV_G00253660 [Gymnothorax javanicus]|nr:hypothetical protein GJAV_G00253660 [Gymnothorax javanicus]
MGSHLCGVLKRRTEDSNGDFESSLNRENQVGRKLSADEVLYTTIDHSNKTTQRKKAHDRDDDCDYAIVVIPSEPAHSSKDDDTNDYVLMT